MREGRKQNNKKERKSLVGLVLAGGGQVRGSKGKEVHLAGCVLHPPRIVANDLAGLLPRVQAHHDGVGRDVPVDALGAGRRGQGTRVPIREVTVSDLGVSWEAGLARGG